MVWSSVVCVWCPFGRRGEGEGRGRGRGNKGQRGRMGLACGG